MKKIICLLMCLLVLCGCSLSNEPVNKVNYASATTIAEFEGASLAGQAGTIHGELASQIAYKSFSEYPSVPDELVALKSGAVDGFICEEPQAIAICEANQDVTYVKLINNENGFATTVEQSGLAIGCKKGSDLANKINSIFKEAEFNSAKQAELMAEMVKVSLGQTVELKTLAYEEVANPSGVLKVGMECDSNPYNWTDVEATVKNYPITDKDGYFCNGYDVQVSAYIAYKLGLKLEVYAYDWDSLIPAVESGAIDAIIAGMSPTAERKEMIDFTDVYYDTNMVIVVSK